ncbi:MAG: 1-acyl-sn-glycerol-3-phosphate acyltransferase [Blastococcus sp.]|nr:1-acyl-sn-glycerol-3-phosphate acyltransferase [Blastococcus sp.]
MASNHTSFYDWLVLPLVVRRRIIFLAKSSYFTGRGLRGRLRRHFFTACRQVPVDRSGGGAGRPLCARPCAWSARASCSACSPPGHALPGWPAPPGQDRRGPHDRAQRRPRCAPGETHRWPCPSLPCPSCSSQPFRIGRRRRHDPRVGPHGLAGPHVRHGTDGTSADPDHPEVPPHPRRHRPTQPRCSVPRPDQAPVSPRARRRAVTRRGAGGVRRRTWARVAPGPAIG